MKTKWVLTQESFDKLLAWLDPDPENAGAKFLEINRKLIFFLARRGCPVAEDLADETMSRVCKRVEDIAPTYEGDPTPYFYRVSRNVYREWLEKEKRWKKIIRTFDLRLLFSHTRADDGYVLDCLDDCLQKLDAQSRDELLLYYRFDGHRKIETRKKLADDLELTPGALATRMYRLRAGLQPCIANCSNMREEQRVV